MRWRLRVQMQNSYSLDTMTEESFNQASMRQQRLEEARTMRLVLAKEVYTPLMEILKNLEMLGAESLVPEVRECHREIADCAQRVNFAIRELAKLGPSR